MDFGAIAFPVFACGLVALYVGRTCARDRIATSAIVRALGSWMALVVAGVLGIVMLYKAFHLVVDFRPRRVVEGERYVLAMMTSIVVFVPVTSGLLFWRRREQARIGADR